MLTANEEKAALSKVLAGSDPEFPREQIIEALPAAVYTTDAQGRIDLYNQAAIKLWGREPVRFDENWCGSWRLYYPDGRPMPHDECPMARALKTGHAIAGEEAMAERSDGSRVSFLAYPKPLRDRSGRITGAVNMLLDISERKATENRLRQREAELTDFIENTTIGLHWVARDGTILWANRAEMALLGYAPEEYIGRHIAEFHADQPVIEAILDRLTRFQTVKDFEARLKCKDGSIKHVLIDSSVYSENGEFIHTRCYTRDVTAQTIVERRLAIGAAVSQILSESNSVDEATPAVLRVLSNHFKAELVELWLGEESLRCVASHSRFDAPGKLTAQTATEGLTFRSGEGLPGRVWQTRRPVLMEQLSDAPDFARRDMAQKLDIGAGIGIPILAGPKCLGVITCLLHRAISADPSLINMMSSIGHKLGQFLERARGEETNRYLAAVVKASPDAIVCATVDGMITNWNEGAERLFGYISDEVMGQPISLIVPVSKASEWHKILPVLRSGKVVEPFETIRRDKAGAQIPVSVSYTGIRDASGQIVGAAAILRDVSEQKATEAQLNGRIRQLEAVYELGMLALVSKALQPLLDRAVVLLARGLDVELAKVLQVEPGGRELRLRAGVGWRDGLVGQARVGADISAQAGYTLSVDQPVIVTDLTSETRFRGPPLLHEHDVVSGLSVPVRGNDGSAFGVLGAHSKRRRAFASHDIHFLEAVANVLATAIQRKTYEERQIMLVQELSHRVKNSLAVIQAIARQTGDKATSFDAFMLSFEGRLFALAQAHDLLTASNWGGASMKRLIELVLGIYGDKKRLQLDLDDITLSATGTQALALVFHELITNAAKYGALSNNVGKIALEGRRKKNGKDQEYCLTWRETGGPPIKKPNRYGFGSKLVESTVQMQCNGTLGLNWRRDGLVLTCTFPLSSICAAGHSSWE